MNNHDFINYISSYSMEIQEVMSDAMSVWEKLVGYDVIYVDACTWMAPEVGEFLQNVAPYLREASRKLTVIPSVRKELENCAPLKLVAQTALAYLEQYADMVDVQEGEESQGTADRQFLRLLLTGKYNRKQILITHDQQLAIDAENICLPTEGDSTLVMTIWPGGEPITFAEMTRRKEAQARARLAEMVGNSPVYMDSSALYNMNVERFLQNVSEPLSLQGKWVQLVRASLSAEEAPEISAVLENNAELVHIVENDPKMSEVEALLGELYLSDANMDAERIILVTDDIVRANELRNRRPKCDRFPFVDFMTINKYGFLSFLKLSDLPSASVTMPGAARNPRFRASNMADWGNAEKKPSSYVPQLIGAIKNDDIESMCEYIDKGANLRNGIITSLCQNKNNCLRVLIERAAEIDVSCFQWWVVSFNNFANAFYLGEDEEHYNLLLALINKCGGLDSCRDAMDRLARLVSRQDAAHERLWHVIRLALEKGAPAHVYSPETGETLVEIAERQQNDEMVNFLTHR